MAWNSRPRRTTHEPAIRTMADLVNDEHERANEPARSTNPEGWVDDDAIEWTERQLRVIWRVMLTVGDQHPAPLGDRTREALRAYLLDMEGLMALGDGGSTPKRNLIAPAH